MATEEQTLPLHRCRVAATSGIEARLATLESAECSQTPTKYPHLVTYITLAGTFRYTRAPKSNSSVGKMWAKRFFGGSYATLMAF